MFTASLASMKREVNLSHCVDVIKMHVHGKANTMLELIAVFTADASISSSY